MIEKHEKVLAEARIEGRAFAGHTEPAPKKMTDREYAKKLRMAGSPEEIYE